MQVKSIELLFENCEFITIPANVIGEFIVDDIKKKIARRAANSISDYLVANTVVLELFKVGDLKYHPFGIEDMEDTKFNRIDSGRDITAISITYEDNTEETYYVNYLSQSDVIGAVNVYQKTYFSNDGNLYLVISENDTIEDYFNFDEINEPGYTDFISDCYNIGVEPEYPQDFNEDNLPQMYRYAYIEDNKNQNLVVRVFDEKTGWKFVYDRYDDKIVHIPKTFTYAQSNIADYLNKHSSFKLDDIIANNPLPNEVDERNSYILSCFEEAKKVLEELNKR